MTADGRAHGPKPSHIAWVLLSCAAVYWVGLDFAPFDGEEGRTVAAGWGLLESGHWSVPAVWGHPDAMRPPGPAWAIAALEWVFGASETSARAVSAAAVTLGALLSLFHGTRRFGPGGGIASGLCIVLLPVLVASGRTAGPAGLAVLATLVGVPLLLDLALLHHGKNARATAARMVASGVALSAMFYVMGAPGLIIVVGAVVAAAYISRSISAVLRPPVLVALAIPGFACIPWLVALQRAGTPLRVPSMTDLVWFDGPSLRSIAALAVMPVLALVLALPASLAVVVVSRRREDGDAGATMARAAAGTVLVSLVLLAALGVRDVRSVVPSLVILAIPVGFLFRHGPSVAGRSILTRRRWVWCVPLIPATMAIGPVKDYFQPVEGTSRTTGVAIADTLPDHAVVWADGMIRVRADVLLYTVRAGRDIDRVITVCWKPGFAADHRLPEPGCFVALRHDIRSPEREARSALAARLAPVYSGSLGGHDFTVYRVLPVP